MNIRKHYSIMATLLVALLILSACAAPAPTQVLPTIAPTQVPTQAPTKYRRLNAHASSAYGRADEGA